MQKEKSERVRQREREAILRTNARGICKIVLNLCAFFKEFSYFVLALALGLCSLHLSFSLRGLRAEILFNACPQLFILRTPTHTYTSPPPSTSLPGTTPPYLTHSSHLSPHQLPINAVCFLPSIIQINLI